MAEGPITNEVETTLAMIEAGVEVVRDFYPAEWGGVHGISIQEARAVVLGVVDAALGTKARGT
jgi:hypothetical protein